MSTKKQPPRKSGQTHTKPLTPKENLILWFTVIVLIVAIALFISFIGLQNSGLLADMTTAFTVGCHTVSNTEFNYYFIDAIEDTYSSWYKDYGDDLSLFLMMQNLDISKPLSAQIYEEASGKTWADYFVDAAKQKLTATYALADEAAAHNYTLQQAQLDELDKSIQELTQFATQYCGFSDLEGYLKSMYGKSATKSSFLAYRKQIALASAYQEHYRKSLVYTQQEFAAYEAAHPQEFLCYSYRSYYVASSAFLVGTTDQSGQVIYSDEAKAQALKKAEQAANALLGVSSADAFNAAILSEQIYGNDTVESTRSTNIPYSELAASFQTWISDSSRKYADMTTIPAETTTHFPDGTQTTKASGYYVLFYESSANRYTSSNDKNDYIREQLQLEGLSTWYTELIAHISVKQHKLTHINTDHIIATGK